MDIRVEEIQVKTVKANYSWDSGNPNVSNIVDAVSDDFEHLGYAPYVNVTLSATGIDANKYSVIFVQKTDFQDFYNTGTSVQTSPTSGLSVYGHTYVMPGTYKLKLIQTQFIKTNNPCCNPPCDDNITLDPSIYIEKGTTQKERLPYSWMWYCFMRQDNDPRTEFFGALEQGSECLTWEDTSFQGSRQLTWEDAIGPAFEVRAQDVSWQWKKVVCEPAEDELYNQKIKWQFTKQNNFLSRTWKQIKELGCDGINCLEVVPVLSANTVIREYERTIQVVEIPPDAYLTEVNLDGTLITQTFDTPKTSPHRVRLSPRFSRCGSFPIEKILWDMGDGTPVFEQTRWAVNESSQFVYNKEIEKDAFDPRNYDVIHSYNLTTNNTNCFYPSITAIASSTSTTDNASTIIGPIQLKPLSHFSILQSELTDSGKVYLGEVKGEFEDKNQTVFWNSKP